MNTSKLYKKISTFLYGITILSFLFVGLTTNAQTECEVTDISFSKITGNINTKETTLSIKTNGACESLEVDIMEQTLSDGETTPETVGIDDHPRIFNVPASNLLKILYETDENSCDGNSGFDCQYFVKVTKPNGETESTFDVIERIHNNGNPLNADSANYKEGVILNQCDGFCQFFDWEFLGSNAPSSKTRCEIGEVNLSPNGKIATGTTLTLSLTPKDAKLCADKNILLEINEFDPNYDNEIDSFWYNPKKLKLDSKGEFHMELKTGEDECGDDKDDKDGKTCRYYVEGYVLNYLPGLVRTKFSTDFGSDKNIPEPWRGRVSYECTGECNDGWKVLSVSPGNIRGGCTVTHIDINPSGFLEAKGDSFSFINKSSDHSPKVAIQVHTSGCYENDSIIEVEPYEFKSIDRDVEEVTLRTGVREDGILNIIYTPGDTDCDNDGDENEARCDYAFRVNTNEGFTEEFYQSEYQEKTTGAVSWLCAEDSTYFCNNIKWSIESHDGTLTESQTVAITQVYDENSPCFSIGKDNKPVFDTDCYELLAPLPGISSEYFDGSGQKRSTGFTVDAKTGRQNVTISKIQLGDYINTLVRIGLGILIVLSVLMIIIAGVQYMTEESIFGKGQAKGRIGNAVTGLIVGLAIFLILSTINPKLLEVNFEPPNVSITFVDIQEINEDGSSSTPITYDKIYTNDNACDETKKNETCVNIPDGITVKPGSGKQVEKVLASRLLSFNTALSKSSILDKWQVTEAFKKTRSHKAACHYTGTCIDMNFTGAIKTKPTSKNVMDVIQAADSAGLCAVYELGTSNTTKKETEPARKQFIADGVPEKKILNLAGHISAPHFSIYNGSC